MPLLIIIVGFAMMTLGVALLLVGEVPFLAGKRISATRSRLIGVVLVSFLPAARAVQSACNWLFGDNSVQGPVVTSLMFSFCCLVTFVILFRVMVPKREARKPAPRGTGSKKNPFGDTKPENEPIEEVVEEAEPWAKPGPAKEPVAKKTEKPPAKKSRKPTGEDNAPFDFT